MVIQGDRFGSFIFPVFVNIFAIFVLVVVLGKKEMQKFRGFVCLTLVVKREKNICSCKQCNTCSFFIVFSPLLDFCGCLCLFPWIMIGKRKERKERSGDSRRLICCRIKTNRGENSRVTCLDFQKRNI